MMLADTGQSRTARRILKRLIYAQLSLRDAVLILLGKAQPRISFTVLADPCSVYINFRLKPDLVREFTSYINLAGCMPLAPIRCLGEDEPELLLTLNIYEVSGLVAGARAEWSTYVADASGVPRYMVLEARTQRHSIDPVRLFTRPDRVEHRMTADSIVSTIVSVPGRQFSSRLRRDIRHSRAGIAPEWVAANDFIYWRNGICDRTWHDSSLANSAVQVIPPADVFISDTTQWARFVDPAPKHVLAYSDGLEFIVAPWFNV